MFSVARRGEEVGDFIIAEGRRFVAVQRGTQAHSEGHKFPVPAGLQKLN